MKQIQTIELPDELFTQIQDMARSQACSLNEQIVTLLHNALKGELYSQTQAQVLEEIREARWTPPKDTPDSVAILREIRGYDD